MNDIFFLLGSDLHNFADNTVTVVAKTIQGLINSLEVKTSNATKWMKDNDMIANPDKFKAIVRTNSSEIDLLGIRTDTELSFDSHIAKICPKASRQLNALKRLGFYIPLDTRKILANSFIISNFNYCPLVWYFSTAKQLQKIEKIQERVLRFLHDDYVSDYLTLLKASGSVSMEIRRMHEVSMHRNL